MDFAHGKHQSSAIPGLIIYSLVYLTRRDASSKLIHHLDPARVTPDFAEKESNEKMIDDGNVFVFSLSAFARMDTGHDGGMKKHHIEVTIEEESSAAISP